MALPEGFLRELRDNNDMVSVAQSYVELKRAGHTYSCRCPFHSERTPSFHVYPDTQSYYCFGCGEQGDVIDFTARYLGVIPHCAVIRLAQDFGIDPHPPYTGISFQKMQS